MSKEFCFKSDWIDACLVKHSSAMTPYEPGYHTIQWDGRNRDGAAVGSGIYLYRLETASPGNHQKEVMTRRMTLLK